ncbi:MAG: T9SS type A sorting domain-containing protein [Bacteroidia bacterium]
MNQVSTTLFFFLVLSLSQVLAQTEYISAKVEGLDLYYSEAGCSDCLASPDPRWRSNILLQGASQATFSWNVEVQEMGACGWDGHTNPSWVPLQTSLLVNAFLKLDFDGWEAEGFGCGATDAACGGYSIIYNILLKDSTPCQWHTFIASRTCTSDGITGTYQVKGRFWWQYSAVKGGTIATNQTICPGGDPVLLTSTVAGSNYGTYQWQDSVSGSTWQNISGATSATFDPPVLTATKSYRRKTTVTCGAGLVAYSNVITITVTPNNDISVAPVLASVCSGTGTSLTATVTGGSTCTIQWQRSATGTAPWTNIGTNSTSANTGALSSAMNYRAYRTCTNSGCGIDTSNIVTVSVIPKPSTPTGSNVSRCGNGTFNLTVSACASGAGTVNWYDASTAGNLVGTGNPFTTPSLSATTNFYAECFANGCASTRKLITATVNPAVSVTAGLDKHICQGQNIGLQAIGSGGTGTITYSWNNGAGTSATPTVSPTTTLTYLVTAKDAVNCTATDNVTVNVYPSGTAGAAFLDVNTAYNNPVPNSGTYPVNNYCAVPLNVIARTIPSLQGGGGVLLPNAICSSGLSVEDNPIFLVIDIPVGGDLSVQIPQEATGSISQIEAGLYGVLPSSGPLTLPLSVSQVHCEENADLHNSLLGFTSNITTVGKYLLVLDTGGDKGNFTVILSFAPNPLACELFDFKGEIIDNQDILSWVTLSETNSDYFEVQHQNKQNEFIPLGKVAAKGTSNTLTTYTFTHSHPHLGKNIYRLAIYDIDGKFNYFQNLVEIFHDNRLAIQLYPNPAQTEITLARAQTQSQDAQIFFAIYNELGQVLQLTPLVLQRNQPQVISLEKLNSGVYFYRIFGENGNQFGKFIKE